MTHSEDALDDIVEDLRDGLTYEDFNDLYGINKYYAGKVMDNIEEEKDIDIGQRIVDGVGKKKFYIESDEAEDKRGIEVENPTNAGKGNVNHTEVRRQKIKSKQSVTRDANDFLKELESDVKDVEIDHDPEAISYDTDAEDILIPQFDTHFGQVVKDIEGQEDFNSEVAEERVNTYIDTAIEKVEKRRDLGHDIQNCYLVLGGDQVTNEAIYEGQAFEIDELITGQLDRASRVFDEQIQKLREHFDHVKVICQAGNHGEFRVDGASNKANADDILFQVLEKMAAKGNYNDVSFVKSDRLDHVNFDARGHKVHVRHGQNVRPHIGTSSPQSDWLAFLNEFRYDLALRGHYHNHRIEHINGVPVLMSGSIVPPGDYEASMALFGRPLGHIIGVSDENPLNWIDYVTFE